MNEEPAIGLQYDQQPHVLMLNPSANQVLLGGLGALGVGTMWVDEQPYHSEYPGYDEAEIVD